MSAHPHDEISAYLDDELEPHRRASLDEHLRQCPACAHRLEELAAVDTLARGLEADAPEGYFDGLPTRVRARVSPRPVSLRRPPAWAWAAAASVFLAVVAPLVLRERGAEAPAETADRPAASGSAAPPPAEREQEADQGEIPRLGPAPGTLPRAKAPPPPVPQAKRDPRTRDAMRALGAVGVGGSPAKDSLAKEMQEETVPREARRDEDSRAFAAPPPPAAAPPSRAGAAGGRGPYAQQAPQAPSPVGLVAATEDQAASNQAGAADTLSDAASPDPLSIAKKAEADRRADAERKHRAEQAATAGRASGARRVAAPEEAQFEALSSRTIRTLADARSLREAWRAYARRTARGPQADEGRVLTIAAGAEAYRRGQDKADLEVLRADTRAYLADAEAPQHARVRELLRAAGLDSP